MGLTPADIHNVAFKMSSIGKRGYEQDEVDAFLDLVEDELARLIEENNLLTSRMSAFEAGNPPAPLTDDSAAPTPPAAAPVVIAPGDASVHAARLLGLAQETAERLTTEAGAEAEATLSAARAESERLRSEAQAESERVRTDAQTQSDALINDAVTKADAAESAAKAKAIALVLEAQTTHDNTLADLGNAKSGLEQKIDGLRTYEREYRTRLKSWITEQLQGLDSNAGESSTAG